MSRMLQTCSAMRLCREVVRSTIWRKLATNRPTTPFSSSSTNKSASPPPPQSAKGSKRTPPTAKPKVKPKPGCFCSGGSHATFNDLPVPEGDFMQAWHAKNNRYNMVLLSGLIALVGSVAFAISSGAIYFNFFVPDYPYTEEELDEFARKKEELEEEHERKELERQDRLYEREQGIKRREAGKALSREMELMQKDLDEGSLSELESLELQNLMEQRDQYEKDVIEEKKRRKEELEARDKEQKEKDKQREEKAKERKKIHEARQKEIDKELAEMEKKRKEAKKQREKAEKEAEKEKARNKQ